ncbi:MAG: BamA/TamA family outer membrane protein [Bacteroidetes bacterium]|nr:BamA/TamA family outer membrane protein [Bacteroidota bacterium]
MGYSQQDTTKLPFAIADEKKLSAEDLKNKKEGFYVAGVPDISVDPLNGLGVGVEGSLFFNGKKSDPFFAYVPYKARLNVVLFYTTKQQRELILNFDVPYIFQTKWRFRAEAAFEVNPNLLFFGNTEKTLQPLSYYPNNDTSKTLVNNASYNDYNNSLTGSKKYFNTYQEQEIVANFSFEHSFLRGKLRTLLGYEFATVSNTTPLNDSSLLHQSALSGKILGYGNNLISFIHSALIFDTRDLEADPSKGIFAEITNELSLTALGSQYNFNKTFAHFNIYQRILPSAFKKFVFAGRIAIGYAQGDVPFYEYRHQWSSDTHVEGLGGSNTIRGYKQARFLARVMQFTNLELRYRFAQCKLSKQHLAFSAVPFFDVGGVWDNLTNLNHLENIRYSEGLGLRIAWNVNTVLRFDYSVSREDAQFFFQLGHVF